VSSADKVLQILLWLPVSSAVVAEVCDYIDKGSSARVLAACLLHAYCTPIAILPDTSLSHSALQFDTASFLDATKQVFQVLLAEDYASINGARCKFSPIRTLTDSAAAL